MSFGNRLRWESLSAPRSHSHGQGGVGIKEGREVRGKGREEMKVEVTHSYFSKVGAYDI